MPNIAIIIPAYNEENRIKATLHQYISFLNTCTSIQYTIVVSLNGCTDQTKDIVKSYQQKNNPVEMVESVHAGKGLAIKNGFVYALTQKKYNYIGFVDADMATEPKDFYKLIKNITSYDGIIASRYMHGSIITPQRPFIKRWGSKLIYEPLISILFGMSYKDYQCGAKLYKTHVIEKIIDHLHVKQWAFDVELLYLCKVYHFIIKEEPTVWQDKAGSKLKITHGIFMLGQLIKLRLQHSWLWSMIKKTNS